MLYGVYDVARDMFGLNGHSEQLRNTEFWAIDDVSFNVKRGECLGIIGPNGAGKSTLLKMLNGILLPDRGKLTMRGRVGALIELGAGFHPMLTGRENIYVNGAILGLCKSDIDRKFDEIVAFAELKDFVDSPVKFYSSGMYVRLGFAVAVHLKPDVLLIDEVLAVGDDHFRSKCTHKIAQAMLARLLYS
jgi:lipopolysaccharide transport system ATP-binding protein